jgi:hypothetical protein
MVLTRRFRSIQPAIQYIKNRASGLESMDQTYSPCNTSNFSVCKKYPQNSTHASSFTGKMQIKGHRKVSIAVPNVRKNADKELTGTWTALLICWFSQREADPKQNFVRAIGFFAVNGLIFEHVSEPLRFWSP